MRCGGRQVSILDSLPVDVDVHRQDKRSPAHQSEQHLVAVESHGGHCVEDDGLAEGVVLKVAIASGEGIVVELESAPAREVRSLDNP